MSDQIVRPRGIIAINTPTRIVICVSVILLMANLNALVDTVHHPEIPYFDEEHLIVGGVTAFVSIVVLGLLVLYARHLERTLMRIRILEALLPICANCKRIREPGADPERQESWKQIESYISERTATKFTHGICPECRAELYPHTRRRDESLKN